MTDKTLVENPVDEAAIIAAALREPLQSGAIGLGKRHFDFRSVSISRAGYEPEIFDI
jgi:hypothetical protein